MKRIYVCIGIVVLLLAAAFYSSSERLPLVSTTA